MKDPEVNILKSFISHPIYVDSRKMAREIQATKVNSVYDDIEKEDGISKESFSRKFTKRQIRQKN